MARSSPPRSLRRVISLTNLLRVPTVRRAWGAFLPGTRHVVREVNEGISPHPAICPSAWTAERRQYGAVGTAFDYLIGSVWARRSLEPVFARMSRVAAFNPEVALVAPALEELLAHELPNVRGRTEGRRQRDFFRGLGLLAHLDAMFRSPAEPPGWLLALPDVPLSVAVLRRHLRLNYPDQFVDELVTLLSAARRDLTRSTKVLYNPVFGGAPGLEHVGADGDLIVGTKLLDLKVSQRRFCRDQVWQLLGYAALDRIRGQRRLVEVGLYNPRYRFEWSENTEVLAARLGAGSMDRFCEWLMATPAATMPWAA